MPSERVGTHLEEGRAPWDRGSAGSEATDSEGPTPRSLPPGVSYFGRARSAASAIARLDWSAVEVGIGVEGERVTALNVSVGRLALLRRCSTAADGHVDSTWDHVVEVQPADAVESAALSSPSGDPLAARLRWSAAEEPLGGSTCTGSPEVVSVSFGCVSLVYPPGFPSRLAPFLAAVLPPSADLPNPEQATTAGRACGTSGTSPAGGDAAEEASSGEGRGTPDARSAPAWLRGGTALGASVISLHVAVLSGEDAGEVAVVMALSRLSAHLGPVRTSARAGSLVADLYGICTGAVPQHGLRVSAGGVQWGIAVPWVYRGSPTSRAGDAEDDEGDLAPGSRPLNSAFGVQALLAASESGTEGTPGAPTPEGPGAAAAGPVAAAGQGPEEGGTGAATCGSPARMSGGWVLRVAVEPIHVMLSRVQLAALSAVVSAMWDEVGALGDGIRSPRLCGPPDATSGPGGAPRMWDRAPEDAASWVDCVGVHVEGLWCVVASGAVPQLAEQPPAPRDSQLVVQCRQVEVRVQGATAGAAPDPPVLVDLGGMRGALKKP